SCHLQCMKKINYNLVVKEIIRRESYVNKREEFYKRFRWSNYLKYPSLFLTQLSYFNSSLLADSHRNLSQLALSISGDIERLYLENDELQIPARYALLLSDITTFVLESRCDLSQMQLDSQLQKLRYLAITNLPQEALRDNAVLQLSRILEKCSGKIDIKSEVEGLSFLLDRLSKVKDVQKDVVVRETIEGILFDIAEITWVVPIISVIKIYSTCVHECTILTKDTILYKTELGILPIFFHSDEEQKAFVDAEKATLILLEGDTNRLIHVSNKIRIEKKLSVQTVDGRYKRTAVTKQGDVVWFYCTRSSEA
ncbi:MAG: hypothetical protein KAG61_00395, partial [Bacteriovoracaceae bacterium]|nr:hypothetical protein [Bacteriovoracaceae bacterium]